MSTNGRRAPRRQIDGVLGTRRSPGDLTVLDLSLTGLAAEAIGEIAPGERCFVELVHQGHRVHVEAVVRWASVTRVERSEPIVKALGWAVRRVAGRRPVFGGVPGSTDGTIIRTALGIPIVTFGPGNRLIPHQVDEHVPVAQLVEATRCYAAAALRFLVPS